MSGKIDWSTEPTWKDNPVSERCPTCDRTDTEWYQATRLRCNDPWHADAHLRIKVAALMVGAPRTGTPYVVTTDWTRRYFDLARHVAAWSKDPSTKVGAVVVGADRRHIAVGYNGFPPGVQDIPERYKDKPTKYLFTQHAERNALDNAPFSCVGGTLTTTMFPCVECAKSMVAKGIARLITPRAPLPIGEPSWRDTIPTARIVLAEGSVEVTELDA